MGGATGWRAGSHADQDISRAPEFEKYTRLSQHAGPFQLGADPRPAREFVDHVPYTVVSVDDVSSISAGQAMDSPQVTRAAADAARPGVAEVVWEARAKGQGGRKLAIREGNVRRWGQL